MKTEKLKLRKSESGHITLWLGERVMVFASDDIEASTHADEAPYKIVNFPSPLDCLLGDIFGKRAKMVFKYLLLLVTVLFLSVVSKQVVDMFLSETSYLHALLTSIPVVAWVWLYFKKLW